MVPGGHVLAFGTAATLADSLGAALGAAERAALPAVLAVPDAPEPRPRKNTPAPMATTTS